MRWLNLGYTTPERIVLGGADYPDGRYRNASYPVSNRVIPEGVLIRRGSTIYTTRGDFYCTAEELTRACPNWVWVGPEA